jgi:hypothetical protein
MSGITYTPTDFVAKLRDNQFASNPISATGFVKLPEVKLPEEEDTLLFSSGSDCTNWVRIPLRLIDHVQLWRVLPCKDHSHPLVTLVLPSPKHPDATVFAEIARPSASAPSDPQAARSVPVYGAVHPIQPHAFLTMLHPSSPSAHALLQAFGTASNMPPQCPDGQTPVWVGDHWQCVPLFG